MGYLGGISNRTGKCRLPVSGLFFPTIEASEFSDFRRRRIFAGCRKTNLLPSSKHWARSLWRSPQSAALGRSRTKQEIPPHGREPDEDESVLCSRQNAVPPPSFEDTIWTVLCQVAAATRFPPVDSNLPRETICRSLGRPPTYVFGAMILISSMELSSNRRCTALVTGCSRASFLRALSKSV